MKKTILLASLCLAITATGFVYNRSQASDTQHRASAPGRTQQNVDHGDDEVLTFRTSLANDKNNQVHIEVYGSKIKVVGHDADEVVIETSDYDMPERAAGLKSLFSQVEDNTKLGLAVLKEGTIMRIVQASRNLGDYTIKVPKNVAVLYHEENEHGGDLELTNTAGALDIELLHGSATLTNITGPINANSVHGRLDIVFSQLNQTEGSTISSVHGPIDIALPDNTGANLALNSSHGEIYTDFDLKQTPESKEGLNKIAGGNTTIEGKTNEGGVAMNITSVHSDIYIRKRK